MTQEIINTLQMLVNENDPDMRIHYAVAINNYILELEKPNTCGGCKHFFEDDFAGCKLYEKDYTRCSRQFESDYYEPKDKS